MGKRSRKPRGNRPDRGGGGSQKGVQTPPRGVWIVNGYSADWLGKGFPWVYPQEILGRGAPADIVELRAQDGRVLGRAIPDHGWIAARVYRHDEGPLDRLAQLPIIARPSQSLKKGEDVVRDIRHGMVMAQGRGLQEIRQQLRQIVQAFPQRAHIDDNGTDTIQESRQHRAGFDKAVQVLAAGGNEPDIRLSPGSRPDPRNLPP